jgi:hypothetical protein
MDRLQLCMEELRRLANETEDLDCVILAEQAINDYPKNEINALRAALERIGKAIDEEARMGQGGDWSLMVGTCSRVLRSCRVKSMNGRKTKPSTNRQLVTKMVTNEHG